MAKAVAVLISDVHYSLNTLPLADASMRQAIERANKLGLPLIVAGDLHDSKANLRAECVNTMIDTFKTAINPVYVLVGNHDKIHEKSDDNALNFLSGIVNVVSEPYFIDDIKTNDQYVYLIPYMHDTQSLPKYLRNRPKGSTIIMHQGLLGSDAGEYMQDKSAIYPENVSGYRVISGHYHARQTIDLPSGLKWDYIGNPYTLTYGEAKDPTKGFQILFDDGSLGWVPTNLRKHIIAEYSWTKGQLLNKDHYTLNEGDLVWVKVSGTKEDLSNLTKAFVAKVIGIDNFRLDLIPMETKSNIEQVNKMTDSLLLDNLIDTLSNTSDERKLRLKTLWKDLK